MKTVGEVLSQDGSTPTNDDGVAIESDPDNVLGQDLVSIAVSAHAGKHGE